MTQLNLLSVAMEFISLTFAVILGTITPFNKYTDAGMLYFLILMVFTVIVNVGSIFVLVVPEIRVPIVSDKNILFCYQLFKLFIHSLVVIFYIFAVAIAQTRYSVYSRNIGLNLTELALLIQFIIWLIRLKIILEVQREQDETRPPNAGGPTNVVVQKTPQILNVE